MQLRQRLMQRMLQVDDVVDADNDGLTGRLATGAGIEAFALAGNAILTIRNRTTGNRFTYKIKQCDDKPDLYFVSVLSGADNTSDYQYLGTISRQVYALGKKSRISVDALSAKAFRWFWDHHMSLPDCIEVWHEGRCGRCGRVLTVPESISSGFGPECIKHVAAAPVQAAAIRVINW